METCLELSQVNVRKLWIKNKGKNDPKLSTGYYK